MENERTEAYRTYMSDSLVLINTVFTKGEIELPRYADIFKQQASEPQETAEQVKSRFAKLRRA